MTTKAVDILIPQRVLEAIELCVKNGAQPSRLTAIQVNAALGDDQLPPYLVSCYVKAWRAKNRRVNKLRALIEAAAAAACYLDELGLHHSRGVLENLLEALKAYNVEPEFKASLSDEEF